MGGVYGGAEDQFTSWELAVRHEAACYETHFHYLRICDGVDEEECERRVARIAELAGTIEHLQHTDLRQVQPNCHNIGSHRGPPGSLISQSPIPAGPRPPLRDPQPPRSPRFREGSASLVGSAAVGGRSGGDLVVAGGRSVGRSVAVAYPAVALAGKILAQRDAGPRLNRNLVVFVAAAANRLAELRAAARLYLAWKSIVADQESMNLTPHQLRPAESKLQETSKQVDSLIGETFTLTPSQSPGTSDIDWQTTRATAAGDLASRVSQKLVSEEKLIATYSGVRIRMDLDRRGLWTDRGDTAVHKLWETYARFPHMPRLASRDVLYNAIANRASTITWQEDTFAYAEAHDGDRWVGLHTDDAVLPAPSGLLIHPDRVPTSEPEPPAPPDHPPGPGDGPVGPPGGDPRPPPEPGQPAQFYARFSLDPVRCIKQLADIAENVSSKLGPDVELVLEIRAKSRGFDESTRRTVSENANSLGAESSEFE